MGHPRRAGAGQAAKTAQLRSKAANMRSLALAAALIAICSLLGTSSGERGCRRERASRGGGRGFGSRREGHMSVAPRDAYGLVCGRPSRRHGPIPRPRSAMVLLPLPPFAGAAEPGADLQRGARRSARAVLAAGTDTGMAASLAG